jgi:hypothetical protein
MTSLKSISACQGGTRKYFDEVESQKHFVESSLDPVRYFVVIRQCRTAKAN